MIYVVVESVYEVYDTIWGITVGSGVSSLICFNKYRLFLLQMELYMTPLPKLDSAHNNYHLYLLKFYLLTLNLPVKVSNCSEGTTPYSRELS